MDNLETKNRELIERDLAQSQAALYEVEANLEFFLQEEMRLTAKIDQLQKELRRLDKEAQK